MTAPRAEHKEESPGCAAGGTAGRATGDKMQREILRAARLERKRKYREERVDIARRFGALYPHELLGQRDPKGWAFKLLGWPYTQARRGGVAVWYVRTPWLPVAVRVGMDADVSAWLSARPGEQLGAWYARVRHRLVELAAEQGVAFGGEVGA